MTDFVEIVFPSLLDIFGFGTAAACGWADSEVTVTRHLYTRNFLEQGTQAVVGCFVRARKFLYFRKIRKYYDCQVPVD